MKVKISFLIIALLFIFPLASAISTPITVKTMPYHKVYIAFQNPEDNSLLESFSKESDTDGKVLATYSGEIEEVNVIVKVSIGGQTLLNEKYEGYKTGNPINIRLDNEVSDGEYVEEVEETTAETNNTVQEENTTEVNETVQEANKESVVTGQVTSPTKSKFNYIYYILIPLVLIGVVAIILFTRRRSRYLIPRDDFSAISKSVSSSIKPQKPMVKSINQSQDLVALEEKIKGMQSELNRLKNKEKIDLAEKKIQQDKDELERLKRGF